MRILIIHNKYQQYGGEQAAVDSQVRLLREKGHEVVLYERDNQEILSYSFWKKIGFGYNTVYSHKTDREIKELARTKRPDIAHIHNVFPLISPSVYLALQQSGIPMVQTLHNFRLLCPNGLFYTHEHICERCKFGNMIHAVTGRCYRNSVVFSALYAYAISWHRRQRTFNVIDGFIALNPFTAGKMVESGLSTSAKIKIIPNFVEQSASNVGPDEHFPKTDLIYLGRLSEEKGVLTLLESLRYNPTLKVRIIGTGPLEQEIRRLSQSIPGQLELAGFLTGEEKYRAVRQALAVIIPSRWYEQFPMVVLEAWSQGTAVIAPRQGPWLMIVKAGETGLLYEPENPTDLAEKMDWIQSHPDEAVGMGKSGREKLEREYTSEVFYQRLIGYYQQIIASRN